MNINLSDEQLLTIVSQAIFGTFEPEKRDAMLKESIATLLGGQKESSYPYKTKLARVYDDALMSVAKKVVEKDLAENPVLIEHMRGVLKDAMEKAFSHVAREKMVDAVADTILKAMSGDR